MLWPFVWFLVHYILPHVSVFSCYFSSLTFFFTDYLHNSTKCFYSNFFPYSFLILSRLVGVGEASFISLAAPFIDDNAPVAQVCFFPSELSHDFWLEECFYPLLCSYAGLLGTQEFNSKKRTLLLRNKNLIQRKENFYYEIRKDTTKSLQRFPFHNRVATLFTKDTIFYDILSDS